MMHRHDSPEGIALNHEMNRKMGIDFSQFYEQYYTNETNKMRYTILPIHQDKMPESYMYETVDAAVAGGVTDFNDPHTPESKGFMICEIVKAVGVHRELNYDVTVEDFVQTNAQIQELIDESVARAKALEDDFEMTVQNEEDAS